MRHDQSQVPLPAVEAFESRRLLSTYYVTNTSDSGTGSFREAILNANASAAVSVIAFGIPGVGVQTITPLSPLPAVQVPITINVSGQQGYTGSPIIQLDGTSAGSDADGLVLAGGTSYVSGLVVNRFRGDGILLSSRGGDELYSNYIGTNAAGTGPLGNGLDGIGIAGTSGNTLLTNLISGNGRDGIFVDGGSAAASQNLIQQNFIGTDISGSRAMGNGLNGIELNGRASANFVGGNGPAVGNVISSSREDGVYIHGAGATLNRVQANEIGTNFAGTAALPNGAQGVQVSQGAADTLIGGPTPAAGNQISGNQYAGVVVDRTSGTGNLLEGNYIGTNLRGTAAIGNLLAGVEIQSPGQTIGGSAVGAGNVISGNVGDGVQIDAIASGTLVQGNWIGTTAAGTARLGNHFSGVEIQSSGNTIGGPSAGQANVISANGIDGVFLDAFNGTIPNDNQIQGNFVGTDLHGTIPLGNLGRGVRITGGNNNLVGGTDAGAGNIIAYNSRSGVSIDSARGATFGNSVLANSIFANGRLGIDLGDDGVTLNTPGGPHAGPNHLQNYPLLTSVRTDASGSHASGTLNSIPNAVFRIEFFASPVADPSGYGQAKTFVGFTTVTTDAAGNARFVDAVLSAKVPVGQVLSATATERAGNTSEFCQDVPARLSGDANQDGTVNFADLVALARNYGATNASWSQGDFDGDGTVDFADLVILASNYLRTV